MRPRQRNRARSMLPKSKREPCSAVTVDAGFLKRLASSTELLIARIRWRKHLERLARDHGITSKGGLIE